MQNEQPPENKKLDPVLRHYARRYALQAMYQWHVAHTNITDLETEFLIQHIDKKIDLEYFKDLIHGIYNNQEEIDGEMTVFLDRPIAEMDPVELSVLRIATYELLKRQDVPYRVVINEALELTKKFGSVEGYKFVNGVLDRVARKTRLVEIKGR